MVDSESIHSGNVLMKSSHPDPQPHLQGTPQVEDFGHDGGYEVCKVQMLTTVHPGVGIQLRPPHNTSMQLVSCSSAVGPVA